jgi:phosphatidylglycerol:prolipoprotein diacylglycerol transferase
MWFIFRKRNLVNGVKTGIYMIGYGVFRFLIEYVREPDIGIGFPIRFSDVENPTYLLVTPWNFTTGQILNFLMIIGGIALILVVNARHKKKAGAGSAPQKKRLTARQIKKKIR